VQLTHALPGTSTLNVWPTGVRNIVPRFRISHTRYWTGIVRCAILYFAGDQQGKLIACDKIMKQSLITSFRLEQLVHFPRSLNKIQYLDKRSYTHSHTLTLTHTRSLTHKRIRSHILTHSHTHTHTNAITHTLTDTLTITHTHSHTHAHTHKYTHNHTHTFVLCIYVCVCMCVLLARATVAAVG
jgi:hypothetical protein